MLKVSHGYCDTIIKEYVVFRSSTEQLLIKL